MNVNAIGKEQIRIDGGSLPFWRYATAGREVLAFDSTDCVCPVPMVNAMAGLERIARSGELLVMINGFEPQGLYERIRDHFTWRVETLSDQRVMVVFEAIEGQAQRLDFGNRHCKGR